MLDFILDTYNRYEEYVVLVVTVSALVFVVSLIFAPFLISKIPQDYFTNPQFHKLEIKHFGHLVAVVIRSFFGFLLALLGLVMLFTPGQGILAIIVGLFLMEFPGKKRLERRIIENDAAFKGLNWMREKFKQPPLDR
ncbi:MAG: hypothetical protein NZ775_06180 [Gammaproteobacteria bacterium]|nr:hypothetical protein [Gammaproteobacteria bacterium]